MVSIFSRFLDICILSSEKGLFKSFAHLKIGLLIFLLLSYKRFLYILDTSPLSGIWFACFLPFCGLSFYFPVGIYWNTKFLTFEEG